MAAAQTTREFSRKRDLLKAEGPSDANDLHTAGSRTCENEVPLCADPAGVQTTPGGKPQHVIDAEAVLATGKGKMKLYERYKDTYTAWRAMMGRVKRGEKKVEPEFREFPRYLIHMGVRLDRQLTQDRHDNPNPTYGPGLTGWATERAQANNRSTTIWLTDPKTKESRPLSEWARMMGVKPNTMRKRLRDGWAVEQVLYGKAGAAPAAADRPWPPEHAEAWEAKYLEADTRQGRAEWMYRRLLSLRDEWADELEELRQDLGELECDEGEVTEAVAALKARIEAREAQFGRLRGHLDRVREQALREMNRRDADAFRHFLDKYKEEMSFAVRLSGIRWKLLDI